MIDDDNQAVIHEALGAAIEQLQTWIAVIDGMLPEVQARAAKDPDARELAKRIGEERAFVLEVHEHVLVAIQAAGVEVIE